MWFVWVSDSITLPLHLIDRVAIEIVREPHDVHLVAVEGRIGAKEHLVRAVYTLVDATCGNVYNCKPADGFSRIDAD